MPVAFGFSVGDFVAVINLIGTVIDALRESSHAGSSFRSLINELYALETALLRVKRLDVDIDRTIETVALRQAASQCQGSIDQFYTKIQKYQPHLQQVGTNSRIKDTWAKVKWAVCKRDDVEALRAEIRGHTSSIEVLLMTLQVEAMTTHARKQVSHHKSLASKIQDFSFQALGKLSELTSNVAQTVQQGKAMLESSAQIIHTNMRIFQMVRDLQMFILKIPAQVQRQQPVYLIDPYNKESPFHLEFVRSAEALLSVLKVNLKDSGCGPAMIDRGEFVIEEMGTQNKIDIAGSWDNCFYPGPKVAMSMTFRLRGRLISSCPRCGKRHDESPENETIW